MSTTPNPQRRSELPSGLYALIDDTVRTDLSLVEKATSVLDGGVRVLQLRMKRTAPREAIAAARAVVERCRRADAVCLINDRVDYALVSGADGVHLGDEDLPPEEARALLGPDRLVGVTVRSLEGIRTAMAHGASYVGLGPIFSTSTKQVAHALLGTDTLQRIATESPLPIVAIAGITLQNIASVAQAGAHCAAVASDLLGARDLTERARALAGSFESGRSRRSIGTSS